MFLFYLHHNLCKLDNDCLMVWKDLPHSQEGVEVEVEGEEKRVVCGTRIRVRDDDDLCAARGGAVCVADGIPHVRVAAAWPAYS